MEPTHNNDHAHQDGHNHDHHAHGDREHHAHHVSQEAAEEYAKGLEHWLAPFFAKLPHIPEGGRKVITDIAPWLSLIFGIIGLVGMVSAGLFGLILSPFILLGGLHGISFLITTIIGLVSVVFTLMSFGPLRAMKKRGWNFAFYSVLLVGLSTLVTLVLTMSGLGGIIGLLIGLYILFEIRERYHV
jgi:hypothetical protein